MQQEKFTEEEVELNATDALHCFDSAPAGEGSEALMKWLKRNCSNDLTNAPRYQEGGHATNLARVYERVQRKISERSATIAPYVGAE